MGDYRNHSADGAKALKSMVSSTMEWFDADNAQHTVNECVQFSRNLIKSLMAEDLATVKAKDKSQMLAYIGKTLDQVARLTQFSQGQPDSRPELSIGQFLALLTPDELGVFDLALKRLQDASAIGEPTRLLPN